MSFDEVTRQVVEGFVADRRDGGYSDARWSVRLRP